MTVDLHLDADQLDQLAELIVDKLATRQDGELITAAQLAERIGRTREYVYAHSTEFGAVRLGDGDRPRLHFRWPHALERISALEERPKRRRPHTTTSTSRPRKQRSWHPDAAPLLPVKDRT